MNIACRQNARDLICRPKRQKPNDRAILTRLLQIVAVSTISNENETYPVLRENARSVEECGPSSIKTQIAGVENDEISSTADFTDGRVIRISLGRREDRKSTRLNSSHPSISYAV